MTLGINISRHNLEKIYFHAEETYPDECCGIITGYPGGEASSTVVHRCTNIQNKLHEEDPENYVREASKAYFIDPDEQLSIECETEKRGMAVIGFYHSHADHAAYFSETDKKNAMPFGEPAYPRAFYIVVSVLNMMVRDRRAFIWNEQADDFVEEPLLVED